MLGGSAAQCAASLKGNDVRNIEPFDVESPVCFAPTPWTLDFADSCGPTNHGRIVLAEPSANTVPNHDNFETSPKLSMMLGCTSATLRSV